LKPFSQETAKLLGNAHCITAGFCAKIVFVCFAGRGRQVIAVCKSADLLLMVLDASKPDFHRDILTRELESVGIRLNRTPPNIYFKKKKTGGISFNAVVPLTHLDEKMCQRILQVNTALMHAAFWCLAHLSAGRF